MILVCAATRTEAGCCRAGIGEAGSSGFEVIATGVGPERAAAALRARLRRGASALVVSSGFAGALTPDVEPLTWITASAVYDLADGRPRRVVLPAGLLRTAPGAIACDVLSASSVMTGPAAGLSTRCAVDMESAALAEVAAASGVPFLVLRLVTDTPARPMAAVGRALGTMLRAGGIPGWAVHGSRAAAEAVRSPRATVAFLRDTAVWRERLRGGWRERATALQDER